MLTDKQHEIEVKFLSKILKDETLVNDTIVKPEMILFRENRELFKYLIARVEQGLPCDSLSLALEEGVNMKGFRGITQIEQTAEYYHISGPFDALENKLQDNYIIHEARKEAENLLATTAEEPDKKHVEMMMERLDKVKDGASVQSQAFGDQLISLMDKHLASVRSGLSGINLGFMNLNLTTDGGQPGELYIIGARPSVGKTAYMLNCITEGVKKDNDVFPTIFSLETDSHGLINRMIATEGRINLYNLKNYNRFIAEDDDLIKKYTDAVGRISKYDMDIRTKENTISKMRSVVRQNKAKYPDKKHAVYIDYLTLIQSEKYSNDMVREMGDITYGLTRLAKDFNVPVIALAQLTRGIESRQDKRPTMSDLRGGGEIEQAANFIGFLYREDYQDQEADPTNEIELIIQKNRDGETGILKYKFFKAFQRMVETD